MLFDLLDCLSLECFGFRVWASRLIGFVLFDVLGCLTAWEGGWRGVFFVLGSSWIRLCLFFSYRILLISSILSIIFSLVYFFPCIILLIFLRHGRRLDLLVSQSLLTLRFSLLSLPLFLLLLLLRLPFLFVFLL